MKSSSSCGSAKIYQFPVGGRASLTDRHYSETQSSTDNAPRVNETICSGSWYHEEAIRESIEGPKPGSKPGWER
jgi:hypothetical protein